MGEGRKGLIWLARVLAQQPRGCSGLGAAWSDCREAAGARATPRSRYARERRWRCGWRCEWEYGWAYEWAYGLIEVGRGSAWVCGWIGGGDCGWAGREGLMAGSGSGYLIVC